MYVDAFNLYSDAQVVTATAASTNCIDHGAARDFGTGREVYVVVLVDVAMTDGSSDTTIAVTVETDDNEAFSTATVVQTIGTFAALSAIGTVITGRVAINERFSRLRYTAANGNLTTGSFTAFLTPDIHKWVAYAKGYTVS